MVTYAALPLRNSEVIHLHNWTEHCGRNLQTKYIDDRILGACARIPLSTEPGQLQQAIPGNHTECDSWNLETYSQKYCLSVVGLEKRPRLRYLKNTVFFRYGSYKRLTEGTWTDYLINLLRKSTRKGHLSGIPTYIFGFLDRCSTNWGIESTGNSMLVLSNLSGREIYANLCFAELSAGETEVRQWNPQLLDIAGLLKVGPQLVGKSISSWDFRPILRSWYAIGNTWHTLSSISIKVV